MNFLKLQLKPQQPHHRSYCRSYNPLALPLIVITLPLLHRACCMYWSRVVVVVVVEGNSCSSSCGSRHRHPQQLLLLLPHRLSLHSLPPPLAQAPDSILHYCVSAFVKDLANFKHTCRPCSAPIQVRIDYEHKCSNWTSLLFRSIMAP